MIGEIFWSCVGVVDTVLGDPIKNTLGAMAEAEERSELRKKREPTYRLAKEKMYWFDKLKTAERNLKKEQESVHPYTGLIELYTKWIEEYKEKLKLLS